MSVTIGSKLLDGRLTDILQKKDINFLGEHIEDINKPTLHDIHEQLINFLRNLHPSKVPELLYRFDLPEIQMSSYTLNGFEEIALLILKREALKVYFRIRFAN